MMLETLKTLCELPGTSGCEDAVCAYLKEQVQPYADEIRTDNLGNLMVLRKGRKANGQTLMLTAHMDEVGVICRGYTEDGCVKFGFVGNVDTRAVIGRRILFEGDVLGVIGIKAVHLTTQSERRTMPKTKDLYIDIGCSGKEAAKKRVPLGTYGVFCSKSISFGDGMLKAKALDGRAGCAILLELLKEQPKQDTWFVFAAQEEVGQRGARCAAFALQPDLCLVVDGTMASDLADVDEHQQICQIRAGAVLSFMDRGTIYDTGICEALKNSAVQAGVRWQTRHSTDGQTDAGRIHLSRDGIRTGVISVPVRYVHSPACVAAEEDIEAVYQIVKEFLNRGKNNGI